MNQIITAYFKEIKEKKRKTIKYEADEILVESSSLNLHFFIQTHVKTLLKRKKTSFSAKQFLFS